ncbi:hypothetical protein LXA43DRAFT_1133977 [Ganoderma leucocontextum]|nr:hypothetical protein LXA43DRAFT_1133977 [Ganoderma leucocontextum]
MQGALSDLLHLGDLAFPEDTSTEHHDLRVLCSVQRLFAEEDRMILSQLAPSEVQEWCVSRITEHQSDNRLLREWYGAAARNAISKNKSHVRALRSAYNDAAPINQYLPPEVLMEVFSHVHPAVMPRPRVPVLRICRYWRQLIFRTPQFWANLLSLPSWKSWNPKYHMGRFQAALARSAPESLTLSVPYSDKDIADILTPHASRLSSFKVGPTWYIVKEMAQVLEQHMPRLTHLIIIVHCWWYSRTSPFNLISSPNIQNLELKGTYFYTPVAPYPPLCHLKLKHCTICPFPMSGSVPALCTVHNALEFFPNLETLYMTYSLSDDDLHGNLRALVPPELTKTVHLPRLRHLEIEDIPAYIPLFLSHLDFPSTTSLVLEPAHRGDFSRWPTAVPPFPGINASPPPTAELSLYLNFSPRTRERDNLVRWETRGDGVRPVRVTLAGAACQTATVSRFTRELVDALAPAPAPGVTSLAVEGSYFPSGYWEQLLLDLPGLRRVACDWQWTTEHLADILGKRLPGGSEFPCARLEEMVLAWDIASYDLALGEEGGEWQSLQGHIGCHESELAASLREFCDMLGACLAARAGRCEPIRRLVVTLYRQYSRKDIVLEWWQVALVEQRLCGELGHLVGDVAVTRGSD